MMFAGKFVLFNILIVSLCMGATVVEPNSVEDEGIRTEKECAYQGGLCVKKEECPKGYETAVKGLCPKQQSQGIECCYSLPLSAVTCKSRGGECVSSATCGNGPRASDVTDCPDDQTCCIFTY